MVNTIKFSEFAQGGTTGSTNEIVGVTSNIGGTNFQVRFPLTWTTGGRPSSPSTGLLGFNTSLSQQEYWDGAAWVQLAGGGSGSVNVGAQNQLAYYAANGSSVSGLATSASSILVTNGSGAPGWSTTLPNFTTGAITFSPTTGGIVGTTTNDSADSGKVGEFVSNQIGIASAIFLISNVTSNVTSISLTAGDWDVWGNIGFLPNPATTTNFVAGGISLTSAILGDVSTTGFMAWAAGTVLSNDVSVAVPYRRVSLGSTTPIYLCASAVFGTNNMSACGGIFARRVR